MGHRTSPSCADELTWQRLADGEADPDRAELLWHHLSGCEACRACMAAVQSNRRVVSELLGKEDDDSDAGAVVKRVQLLVQTESSLQPPIAGAETSEAVTPRRARALLAWPTIPRTLWPRFAAAASLAALAVMLLWLPSAKVSATPDFVLSKARVSERAWTYQPGKVLRWVTEADIRGNPYMPDGRYRSLWWRSNVEEQTGEILRKYDDKGQLSMGRWTKADGRVGYFTVRIPNRLSIEPSDAAFMAVLPSLSPVQQDAVRRHLRERSDFSSALVQRQAMGDLLVDVAEGQKRNRTLERRTIPEWGTVYYLRGDWSRENTQPWRFEPRVARFVDEQYIGLTDFRPYRRKTTRYNERGEAIQVEDARYLDFGESTLAEFRAEDLDFDGVLPKEWTAQRRTPEQYAELIARQLGARRATADAPKTPATRNK